MGSHANQKEGGAKRAASLPSKMISGKLAKKEINRFRSDVLAWYDCHRRILPWRAASGQGPDPYRVWLSEIMLQQTTVVTVAPYFQRFIEKWPTIHDLAAASQDEIMKEWAGLGYYARARNLHKCGKFISINMKGRFPENQDELKSLPGIGDYTAAAIASIAFNKPAVVVDGNVERVMARYFCIRDPLPDGKKQLKKAAAALAENRTDRPGDYAQALMDLGAMICTPKSPKCFSCPVKEGCRAKAEGLTADLPMRRKKVPLPKKYGRVYWVFNPENNSILVEKRPGQGILGGLYGFPMSEWETDPGKVSHNEKIVASGTVLPLKGAKIRHVFTHFDLTLEGFSVQRKTIKSIHNYKWVKREDVERLAFPRLFIKFLRVIDSP